MSVKPTQSSHGIYESCLGHGMGDFFRLVREENAKEGQRDSFAVASPDPYKAVIRGIRGFQEIPRPTKRDSE